MVQIHKFTRCLDRPNSTGSALGQPWAALEAGWGSREVSPSLQDPSTTPLSRLLLPVSSSGSCKADI